MNDIRTRGRWAAVLGIAAVALLVVLASVVPFARQQPGGVQAAGPSQTAFNPQTAPLPQYSAGGGSAQLAWEIPLHFSTRTSVAIAPPILRDGPAQMVRGAPQQLVLELYDRAGAKIQTIYAWHPLRIEHEAVPGPTFAPPRVAGAQGLQQADPHAYNAYQLFRDVGDGWLYIPYDPRASSIRIVDQTLGGVELGRVSVEGAARRYCAQLPASAFCRSGASGAGGPSRSTLYFDPYTQTVGSGSVFTIALKARRMVDLYGGQVAVTFDPAVLQVVDQDPGRPGAQVKPGDFPKPDTVLRNAANSSAGRLEYYFTLTGEKPGVSGQGTVAHLVLRGIGPGPSLLAITDTVLSDPQSLAIPIKTENALITVLDGPAASVVGQVELERRPTSAGARVCSSGRCVVTGADGAFKLDNVPVGQPVEVTHPSYLRTSRLLPANATGTVSWPKVKLLAGDFDKDDRVDIVDAAMIGQRFNLRDDVANPNPRFLAACDITDDDVINILDMTGVQFNMLQTAPIPWPTALVHSAPANARPGQTPRIYLLPDRAQADGLGVDIPLELLVDDVARLYAYRVRLRFDPQLLQVMDASPGEDGVQVELGEHLDPINSFVLLNRADNEAGTVDISITSTAPAVPVSGFGLLARITFRGRADGESAVDIAEAVLADDTEPVPQVIAVDRTGATITVKSGPLGMYLPWLYRP